MYPQSNAAKSHKGVCSTFISDENISTMLYRKKHLALVKEHGSVEIILVVPAVYNVDNDIKKLISVFL